MTDTAIAARSHLPGSGAVELVTMFLDHQQFGIPVQQVCDVLSPQPITRIPLAPPAVAGSLNLRGRIVTAIDTRVRLGMRPDGAFSGKMNVVVEHDGELYSLIVDQIGEVTMADPATIQQKPATLDPAWAEFVSNIYRLSEGLLIEIDVGKLLGVASAAEPAAQESA